MLLNLSGRGDKDVAQMMDDPRLMSDRLERLGTLETALRTSAPPGSKLLVPYITGGYSRLAGRRARPRPRTAPTPSRSASRSPTR